MCTKTFTKITRESVKFNGSAKLNLRYKIWPFILNLFNILYYTLQ